MIKHILVPLDGSALAECVIPHVHAVATALEAHITLLHVVETYETSKMGEVIDLLDWNLKKRQAAVYMNGIAERFKKAGLKLNLEIQEGAPAERIIDFARSQSVDLIILSTHGRGGLSGWNISSIVQKIIHRSNKSILLVRAYQKSEKGLQKVHYKRLFVGLDASRRAEFVIPVAVRLAQYHHSKLILGTVIRKTEMLDRFPLTTDEQKLVEQITTHNREVAAQYLDQISRQVSVQGVETEQVLKVNEHITQNLHKMTEEKKVDMVILSAHGQHCEDRWPYGSVTHSFIDYGSTTLLVLQDFSADEIQNNPAEIATRQTQGH